MDKWKEIWRKDERINKIVLEALIKADGFDVGAGSFTVDDWLEYTGSLYEHLKMKKADSVFDVGCGSGAFVYPLELKQHKVGGLDYSSRLIELATMVMPQGKFYDDEACNIRSGDRYEIVLSHSVFQYFKNLDYAKNVIKKMVKISNNKVAIFDINDVSKKDEYHEVRMMGMSKEAYAKKYEGLEHQFYNKKWFENIAGELNMRINIFDQEFEKYKNSYLRFNVIMEK